MFKDFNRGYVYSTDKVDRDIVNFDYYTIPFDEYIKVESDYGGYTDIMIYGY